MSDFGYKNEAEEIFDYFQKLFLVCVKTTKRLNLQHCKSADLTKYNGRILLLSLFRYSKNDLVTLL